ncbi:solute carrier family 35 member G1-like [Diadema antillarum]|uniref:solute carrier family 35 member G1-like n=1 Tax=Diadema antillarum TaxID=105358 RepID=UPI003A8A01C7
MFIRGNESLSGVEDSQASRSKSGDFKQPVLPSPLPTTKSDYIPSPGTTPTLRRSRRKPEDVIENGGCHAQGLDNFGYDETTDRGVGCSSSISSMPRSKEIYDSDYGSDVGSAGVVTPSMSDSQGQADRSESACSLNRYKGVTLALVSTILISFATLCVALLAGSVGSNEVVFAQMLIQFLICVPLGVLGKVSFRVGRTAFLLVLYRSVIGSICSLMAYFAFQVMPMGNAKAIIYSSPVFTALFSCLILHETCTAFEIVFSAVTLFGVFLVIQPTFVFGGTETSSTILGPIFALIVAILVGTIFISLRKIGQYRVHPVTLLIVYSLIALLFSSSAATIFDEWVIPRCGRDRILLVLTAVFTFLSQITVTLATRYEKATMVSLIRTSDVLFTFTLEYFFIGTFPNYITMIGAALILGSLIGITLRKWWREKKKLEEKNDEDFDDKSKKYSASD